MTNQVGIVDNLIEQAKRARNFLRLGAVNLVDHALITPMLLGSARDKNVWIVYGWKGYFRDNAKYFFLYLQNEHPEIESYFLTFDDATLESLELQDLSVLDGREPSTWKVLSRAGAWIVDHGMYRWEALLSALTRGSVRAMLWHGAPMKRFWADNRYDGQWSRYVKENKTLAERAETWARRASFPQFDLVVSTSPFVSPRMKSAFSDLVDTSDVIAAGYPRNDILTGAINCRKEQLMIGASEALVSRIERIAKSHQIVLYMPTYRDHGDHPLEGGAVDLRRVQSFCEQHDLYFLLKLHPAKLQNDSRWSGDFPNVIWVPDQTDIYPLLSHVDLLISDYSSISFDFLLLDRPLVFYAYDIEDYLARDRELHFEYDEITPGDVAYSHEELLAAIKRNLEQPDQYKKQRADVCLKMMGAQQGSASEKIYRAVCERLER